MIDTVLHIFTPRKSNEFKAKILHFKGLFILGLFIALFQFGLNFTSRHTSILGYASNISIQEVIKLTNVEREKSGLSDLTYNESLSAAAKEKGEDMLALDYWAHVSPTGTEPWYFFKKVGYNYRYAGENLARDFTNANSAVEAWMASPSHRENILSDKYQEIGIAVVEGDLAGEDTTIIVQLFGSKGVDRPSIPVASAENQNNIENIPLDIPEVKAESEVQDVMFTKEITSEATAPNVLVSPFSTSKTTSVAVLIALFAVLLIDMFYIETRGVSRRSGRMFAHLAFIVTILIIVLVAKAGKII